MKKIKYIFGIGIIGALFSSCFGYYTYTQTFLDSSENKLTSLLLWNQPSYTSEIVNKCSLYDIPSLNFAYCGAADSIYPSNHNLFFNFGSSNGGFVYSIGGDGYGTNGNVPYYSIGSDFTYGSIKNSEYPLILNTTNGKYLTFSNENTLVYNGQNYHFNSNGLLKSCFYGVGESISCALSDGTFINVSFGIDNNIYYNTGVLVIPIKHLNDGVFTGNLTLLIAVDSNDRIIYNIVNSYSSNITELQNSTILSAGYSMYNLSTFISKSFMDWNQSPDSYSGRFINTIYSSGVFYDFPLYTEGNGTFYYWGTSLPYFRSGDLLLVQDSSIGSVFDLNQGGSQPTYSGNVSLSTCIETQVCWDYTGSQGNIVRMCTTECVSSGVIASGGYIGSDGTYYFVNSPISIEDSLKTDNPENMFTGSYIDSGGILSLSYFTDYFQPGAKKIGVCPFKYYEGPLDFMTKLKIGDVYLLMPILCFYSAFQQGKNVSFFDQYNVNDGLFSQPMLYGESDNHKLLFAFFDVLFSIGLLGLIRYLSRHLF